MKVLLCCLLGVGLAYARARPQDSYLALLPSQQQPTGLYSSPDYFSSGSAIQASSLYSGPTSQLDDIFSLQDNSVDYDFDLPQQTFGYASENAVETYGAPSTSEVDEVYSSYGSPSESVASYSSAPQPAASNNFVTTKIVQEPTSLVGTARAADPITLVRSEHVNDNHGNWNYMYEAENGIFQEAKGEMRSLGDTQVHVMSGSYSYVGPDGQTYQVDWYADETGYHPSAPHIPQPVQIPYPEIAEAVARQLEFAAEQDAQAAASNNNGVTINLGDYDDLAGYGSNLAGYNN